MRITDGHGQQLAAIDASFLRLESPLAPMRIDWSAMFSVPEGIARPTIQALRARATAGVPRLENGRVGVVGRVHHAMADGTAAMMVATLLLDTDQPEVAESPAWTARGTPGAMRWATDPVADGVRLTQVAVRGGVGAVRHPRTKARAAARSTGRVAACAVPKRTGAD